MIDKQSDLSYKPSIYMKKKSSYIHLIKMTGSVMDELLKDPESLKLYMFMKNAVLAMKGRKGKPFVLTGNGTMSYVTVY